MAIDIYKEGTAVVLYYSAEYPDGSNAKWVIDHLENYGYCRIAHIFKFEQEDLIEYDSKEYSFVSFKIADLITIDDKNYYQIKQRILDINYDLFFEESCDITADYFFTERKSSIFKIIDEVGIGDKLVIGGSDENSISEEEYKKILKSLPNGHELYLYDRARVFATLKNYFPVEKDKEYQFNRYVEKKLLSNNARDGINLQEIDIERYEYLLKHLKYMLDNEVEYQEADWQKEILKIIKIIFPKYVIAIRETKILKGIAQKDKHVDILLGDVNGHVDIIEIKKPCGIELLRKNPYRENYIPSLALQGAIMQAEKYIFYLMKNGKAAEESLDEQTQSERTEDYHFKIINPKSIIIMGKTSGLNSEQRDDFEVIKRKYANVLDIISYEDLIHRLEMVIEMLKQKEG
jgi:hypothetical protein